MVLLTGMSCGTLPFSVNQATLSAEVTPPTSATPEPTATPTIVWFPPTATFTPFPTSTLIPPTPEMRPGVSKILLQDNFTESTPWTLHSGGNGRISLGKEELTIAIQEDKAYLMSFRNGPTLSDFYAEITVNPNLCQDKDEYGLLVRVTSAENYYRYALSCDGQVRVDRILSGSASSPQPWMDSGMIPIGSPSISRLAVWAVGAEMRFFANDTYLFTVRDPAIPAGTLGVFARSSGGHALTVNFSNLIINELSH